MGGRFETCTRFAPYFTKKIRLETLKSNVYEETLHKAPKNQPVMVVCVSAASPLQSSKALSLMEDVNGAIWERDGNMDEMTRTCSRKADDMPYRIYQFDITERKAPVADKWNMDSMTRTCSRKADDMPYRIYQFDITEASSIPTQAGFAGKFDQKSGEMSVDKMSVYLSRLLADKMNLKSVPMYLIYYSGRLVYANQCFTTHYNSKLTDHHMSVDRMYENIHKKAFGHTVTDVMKTLEQARSDGSKGKFLPHDLRFGVSASALTGASALAKIKPFPSATIANAKKRPLLQAVVCEPTATDGIDKRMGYVFGRSGVIKPGTL
ncbi:hypothetical protein T484DRAFT_1800655 [Baffinella frigidus]|nr:hypothetical protein T484DRAFT_1800655 [Cryptophyta sp. CCMP2293]